MRTLLATALAAATLGLSAAPALAARDGPYLFDLVNKPSYRRAWTTMVSGTPAPAWIKGMRRPSSPNETLVLPDGRYARLRFAKHTIARTISSASSYRPAATRPGASSAWRIVGRSGSVRRLRRCRPHFPTPPSRTVLSNAVTLSAMSSADAWQSRSVAAA
jgi:hypothetical protein